MQINLQDLTNKELSAMHVYSVRKMQINKMSTLLKFERIQICPVSSKVEVCVNINPGKQIIRSKKLMKKDALNYFVKLVFIFPLS